MCLRIEPSMLNHRRRCNYHSAVAFCHKLFASFSIRFCFVSLATCRSVNKSARKHNFHLKACIIGCFTNDMKLCLGVLLAGLTSCTIIC